MSLEFHFLVVDDLPTVRWIVIALLKEIGYTNISEAGDGEHALQLIQSNDIARTPINFVVTDWNMPVMNGLALLQAIRAHAELKHLPVLMVTGEAEAENILAATQAGVDGYIVKPLLSVAILKEALNKILVQRGLVA